MIFKKHHVEYACFIGTVTVAVVAKATATGGLVVLMGLLCVWQLGKRQGADDLYERLSTREAS